MMYPLYFDVVFKEIGQFYIKQDETLTLIGSVAFASNSLFKLITGIVLEIMPVKKVNCFILAMMFVHIFTLEFALKNWASYMMSSIMIMGCEGAFVTLQAVIVMQQFGLRRGPEVYSYTLSAQAAAATLMTIFV